jgi:hypothetical protein
MVVAVGVVAVGYSPGYSYAQTAALPVSDDPVDSNDRMVYVHFVEEFNPLLDVEASEVGLLHTRYEWPLVGRNVFLVSRPLSITHPCPRKPRKMRG